MNFRIVVAEEHREFLLQKLLEEVAELIVEASNPEIINKNKLTEELADVYEVLEVIQNKFDINGNELSNVKEGKKELKGSFQMGIVWDGSRKFKKPRGTT